MGERRGEDSQRVSLDPKLLRSRFRIQTNWHVVTGAPCSGKTTIIEQIATKGYRILPETGRMYVEREIAAGRTLEEVRANEALFCRVIKDLQLARESDLKSVDVIFLDRAFPDSLAFYRLAGLDPNEILLDCFRHRYASVSVLDRFPSRKDAARVEDDVAAGRLDRWTRCYYSALGYDILRVPVLPLEDRCMFVLQRLADQGFLQHANRR